MRNKYLFYFLTFFFLFFGNLLFSQSDENGSIFYYKNNKELLLIGKEIQYLEDKTSSFSIDEILKPEIQKQFKRNEKEFFVKKPTSSAFWFKLRVSNQTDSDLFWALSGTNFWELDYYIPKEDRYILAVQKGLFRMVEVEDKLDAVNWLPIPERKEAVNVYVRFYTERPITVTIQLGTNQGLLKHKAREDYLTTWFLGAVMAMFIYNLFLLIIIKDRIYFWYICYVFFAVLLILHANNFPVMSFLFDEKISYFLSTHPFSWMSLGYIFSGIFSVEFLKLSQRKILLWIVFTVSIFFPAVFMFLDTWNLFPHSTLVPIFQFTGISSLLSMFLISLYLWQKEKNKNARFYCLGWFWILLSAIVFFLTVNGFIEYSFFRRNANYIGIVLETLFFSLALGDRINTLKEENFQILRSQNENLEHKVEERTKELKDLNKQFERISDNMPGALFEYLAEEKDGLTGHLTFLSSGIKDVLETSKEDILRDITSFWKLIHPNDMDRIIQVNSKCNQTGESYNIETQIITPSGMIKWVQLIARGIPVNENKNYLWSGVIIDITNRKMTDKQLLLLSTALEKAANGVFISDFKGKIQWVNSAFLKITGYSEEEVIGQNPELLNSNTYNSKFYKEMWKEMLAGNTWSNTMLNKRRDGSVYYDEQTNTPILDEYGQVTHFISIRQDVTNRIEYEQEIKRAKEAAESSNRAKSEFLANMSHEIRTPINSILGFSELLSSQLIDNKFRYYANSISLNGRILLQLINDFLDLSKIESGKIELDLKPIQLIQILDEMKIIFTHKIDYKKVDFITEINPKIPASLYLDETRIRQVLLNLIGNAIKFTDFGFVKVTVDGVMEENFVNLFIKIEDTGIGIPEQELENIFESFVQVKGQDSNKYGGTGLGLSISKKLVSIMNGGIEVASKVGKGSTFVVTLKKVQFVEVDIHEGNENKRNMNLNNVSIATESKFPNDENAVHPIITILESTVDPKLKEILQNEKIPIWKDISEILVINEIVKFTKDIQELAREYKSQNLRTWAEALETYSTQYDIENINNTLARFSDFLE